MNKGTKEMFIHPQRDNLHYDWCAPMHEKLYVWKFLQIKWETLFTNQVQNTIAFILLVTRRAEFRAHIQLQNK